MVQKILVLAANPRSTPPLRLDQEMREIEEGLRRSRSEEQFVMEKRLAVRIEDLRRALLDEKPLFVHFCGHGSGQEGIMLEDLTGYPQLVKAEPLANLFKLFSNQVKCIVLNACYSEVQATALSKHIDYVIGMSQAIDDKSSIHFSTCFYDAIGAGRNVEDAFEFGKNAIELYNIPEEFIPVLRGRSAQNRKPSSTLEESKFDLPNFSTGNLLNILVTPSHREKIHLIRNRTIQIMRAESFDSEMISAFSTCLEELTTNAFEHGCRSVESEVHISVEITDAYLTILVKHQDQIKFDLEATLKQKTSLISSNPYSRRGRGLITVNNLSDSLESVSDGLGVKATIYKDRVKFNIQNLEKLMIIEVIHGLYNPSINRRLLDLAVDCHQDSLIIHIPKDDSTKFMGALLDLYEIFKQSGRKFVIFVGVGWESSFNIKLLPSEIIAKSWNEALNKVDKSEFQDEIETMCHQGALQWR
jgi:anti-sigma regulatory factor (Ser/Thr protein kinase)